MKYPRRQGLKKLSATHIVGKRRRVWSCRGCGMIANAKPTQCASCGRLDFISWDSAGEQKRWATLTLLEKAGEISNLQRQITFDLYAWNEDKRQPVKVLSQSCPSRAGASPLRLEAASRPATR